MKNILNESSKHEAFFGNVIDALDAGNKNFNSRYVKDTNKVAKALTRFMKGIPQKYAMQLATSYADYRNGHFNKKAAAKKMADIMKPHQKNEVREEDEIKGGKADGKTIYDIANHHKIDIDQLLPEFQKGAKVEREHTSDTKQAAEIALDHLYEDPNYYSKLEKVHTEDCDDDLDESINEGKSMDSSKKLKIYNSLNKGDLVDIEYDSTIRKGHKNTFVVTKGKTVVGKRRVERITLALKDKKAVKFYLYQMKGQVTLAIGDMAAVITDMKPHQGESSKKTTKDKQDTKWNKQIKKIRSTGGTKSHTFTEAIHKDAAKLLHRIRKDWGDQDLYYDVQDAIVGGNVKSLISVLKNYDVYPDYKRYLKNLGESINEVGNEPEVITQLRKIVKDGQHAKIKDPKTGKKTLVDMQTANVVTQVYDALKKPANQERFVAGGLRGMVVMAWKMIK